MSTDEVRGGWNVGEQDTVLDVIRRAVEKEPDAVFLDIDGGRHTYLEIWTASMARAGLLRDLGVTAGSTVVCMLDNNVDAVTSWYAANALGAIWVPVNTALKGEFLRHQVGNSGARVVIAEPDYAVRILAVVDELPELQTLLVRGGVAELSSTQADVKPLETAAEPLAEVVQVLPGDLAMLIYTSGTTGPSKGCMLSHNYVCNVARGPARRRPKGAVLWTPLPLFHLNAAATSVLATAYNVGSVVVSGRFSLSGFWPEIERTGATEASVLGVMITLIAAMPETPEMLRCKGQLQHVGGAPWTADLINTWKERFGVKSAGSSVFGLTEATFITSNDEGLDAPLGSSGRRNDDFDVRIVDDNDQELPPNTPGEIMLRPLRPHVMFEGYWRQPEATQAVLKNFWFHTGDIAKFDDAGWFWFVDRKKDYLRRGGENISSFELETAFRKHPDIAEVAVHAVPSELSEDDVKVTVILKETATVTEEELCRWSVERLPYYAVPRFVEFRPELPKNATGKVLKYQLRDEGVTAGTWDRSTSDIVLSRR